MDELVSRCTIHQTAVPLMKLKLAVRFSFVSRYRYFVSVTTTAENPLSHKHVVIKVNKGKPFISIFDKLW
jgi:hypothetical protein